MTVPEPASYPVLGIPVDVRIDHPEGARLVERLLGPWRALSRDLIAPVSVSVTIGVDPDAVADVGPMHYEVDGSRRLRFVAGRARGEADAELGKAWGTVPAALLRDGPRFAREVLEAMIWTLLAVRDRFPLHGALVEVGGRPVLLCGPSGSGKSSLAYAASGRGWPVRSDDRVFVETETFRLWTAPAAVRLRPDHAARVRPMAGATGTIVEGKRRVLVEVDGWTPGPVTDPPVLCRLRPGRAAGVTPVAPDDMRQALASVREAGFRLHRARAPRVAAALVSRAVQCLWLDLGADPGDALDALERALVPVTPP